MKRFPLLIGIGVVGLATLIPAAGSASAHPLGNLTVNTSATITVAASAVTVDYVLDLAELPTVQEQPMVDAQGASYAATKCNALMSSVSLIVDDAPSALAAEASTLAMLPGQGGLSTLRLECQWTTASDSAGSSAESPATLSWNDANFADRLGWREVIALGDGMTLSTDLPTTSASDFLRSYPTDVPAPRVLSGEVAATPGGPRLAAGTGLSEPSTLATRGADGLTQRFNRLVGSRELTGGLALAAMGIALLLGALHSLAPGHGKTLMAAMVASRRGTVRQVVTVGATVAATHTVGVVVLGVIITTSQAVAPDRVLPGLTVLSGVLLLATGGWLLSRRIVGGANAGGHQHGVFGGHHHPHAALVADHESHPHPHVHGQHGDHAHGHGHHHDDHHHDDHDHDHHHDHHGHAHSPEPLKTRSLALIGMAGGLVPTPSALVVLLGATALGRAWFGVVLVGIYGIGMAGTLLVAGYALVRLQGWLERQYADARWLARGLQVLPVLTAAGLMIGGISLAVRGAIAV